MNKDFLNVFGTAECCQFCRTQTTKVTIGFNDLIIPCQTVTVGHITLGHTFPGVARISLGAKH